MHNKIATINEIPPGEIRPFEVNGKSIAIANLGGEFFAISDLCTHAGCSLGEGELEENIVTCPCHGASFDVRNGQVTALPAVKDVTTYKIKREGDDLVVDID